MVFLLPEGSEVEELLSKLVAGEARSRDDLRGGNNLKGGSRGHLGFFVEIGDQFLKSSLADRYEDVDEALRRAVPAEARRQSLEIYHPDRWWFLCRGADGACWSSSLMPRLETLRERFNREYRERWMASSWDLFLQAFRTTFETARRFSVLLDCNPNNFGLDSENGIFYIDDDVARSKRAQAAFGIQALLRLREYPDADLDERRAFLERWVGIVNGYERSELLGWGLGEDLHGDLLWPPEESLRELLVPLRERLERSSERRRH